MPSSPGTPKPRLPIPGQDAGEWGELLNDYLRVIHDESGELKKDAIKAPQLNASSVTAVALATNSVGTSKLADDSVTEEKLAAEVRDRLGDVAGKAEVVHSHEIGDVSQLQTKLNVLQSALDELQGELDSKQAMGEYVTNTDLTTGLAQKANTSHGHSQSDIANLSSDLSSKATVASLEAHTSDSTNPHAVTKTQVGLGNVDNTSDLNKPISTATQTALNAKQATLVSGTNIKTVNGTTLLGSGNLVVGGAVDSVNSQTGVVVLDADDISDTTTTNKFVTAAEKTKLANLSGTNTGDQELPTWTTISGKPEVVAAGATQADARTAIGAGTSSFSGSYADLTNKPTIPDTADDIGAAPATQTLNAQTGSYTLVAADATKIVIVTASTAANVIVPANVFSAGQTADVLDAGTARITFVAGSGMTLNATPSLVSRAQYSGHTIVFTSATTAVVTGDLA